MPKLPLSPLLLSVGLFAAPAMAQPAPAAPPPPAPVVDQPTLPPAPVPDAPKVEATPPVSEPAKPAQLETTQPKDGFGLVSSDGAFSLKIKGCAQADGRFFFAGGTNQFLLRRVRPTLEGTIYRYFDYRITAELAGAATALDVWANVRLAKEFQFRAGKFKSPIGLERLQNDPEMPFIERGLPTDSVPDRDVGVMVHGEIADGTVAYALAVFNGAEDNKSIDTDSSDKKDVAGRIFSDRSCLSRSTPSRTSVLVRRIARHAHRAPRQLRLALAGELLLVRRDRSGGRDSPARRAAGVLLHRPGGHPRRVHALDADGGKRRQARDRHQQRRLASRALRVPHRRERVVRHGEPQSAVRSRQGRLRRHRARRAHGRAHD